jgi:hypothetical protein
MKKNILDVVAIATVAAIAVVNVTVNTNNIKVTSLSLKTVEALTTECIKTSPNNTGVCRKKTDGKGLICVPSAWYESNTCNGQMDI